MEPRFASLTNLVPLRGWEPLCGAAREAPSEPLPPSLPLEAPTKAPARESIAGGGPAADARSVGRRRRWHRGRFLARARRVGVGVVAAGRFLAQPFGFAFFSASSGAETEPPLAGAEAVNWP